MPDNARSCTSCVGFVVGRFERRRARALIGRLASVKRLLVSLIRVHGVEFPDGSTVMKWRFDPCSVAFYSTMDDLVKIHGHGGKTLVRFRGAGAQR